MAVVSRLSFCMYLCHPAVIYWAYAQQAAPFHFSRFWLCASCMGKEPGAADGSTCLLQGQQQCALCFHALTHFSTGILSLTILVAAVVHLGVEQPAANLLHLALGQRNGKHKGGGVPPSAKLSSTVNSSVDEHKEEEKEDGNGGGNNRAVMIELGRPG